MEFYLVDVVAITPPTPEATPSELEKIKHLSESIVESGGLIQPLILCQTDPFSFALIAGRVEYFAALKAWSLDPRNCEMVNAMVVPAESEEAVTSQLELLGMEVCQ